MPFWPLKAPEKTTKVSPGCKQKRRVKSGCKKEEFNEVIDYETFN